MGANKRGGLLGFYCCEGLFSLFYHFYVVNFRISLLVPKYSQKL